MGDRCFRDHGCGAGDGHQLLRHSQRVWGGCVSIVFLIAPKVKCTRHHSASPVGAILLLSRPLRYNSIGKPTLMFSTLAYFSWRVLKGDVLGGFKRRLRRRRGIYLEDSMHDNADYHVTRNGVDQDAICRLFEERGFDYNTVRYFSTQSRLFQRMGSALGLRNTFAVVAQRNVSTR